MFGNSAPSFNLSLIPLDRRKPSQQNSTAKKQTLRISLAHAWRRARIGRRWWRRRRLLNNSQVETHDWCGTFHFHTFQRSLLAQAPNRPSGLCSSKPVTDGAFLVGLRGTRVALFFDGGVGEGSSRRCLGSHTCVCSLPNNWELWAILSCEHKVAHSWGTRAKNLGPRFNVAGKPEKPADQPARVQIDSGAYGFIRQTCEMEDQPDS